MEEKIYLNGYDENYEFNKKELSEFIASQFDVSLEEFLKNRTHDDVEMANSVLNFKGIKL